MGFSQRGTRETGVLVPSGDRSGPTEPAGETLASLVLIEPPAHVRGGGRLTLSAPHRGAPPPKGEARLGSPFGRAVAARRLRGQPVSAPHTSVSPTPSLIPKGGTRFGRGDRRAWRKPPWHRRCHQGSRLPPRSALNGAHRAPAPRNPLKRVDLNFTWPPAGCYYSNLFPPHLQGPGGI